jgi:chromosome segregation ATPase
MNTQEALIEVEKLIRTWKAVERVKDVLETVNSADNYVKELVVQRDSLVSEVATVKTQIEVLQAAKEAEKQEAGKVIHLAKQEAKEIKDKATKVASEKLSKATVEAEEEVKKINEYLGSLKADKTILEAQKASLAKDVAELQVKYDSIKAELAKLLGK